MANGTSKKGWLASLGAALWRVARVGLAYGAVYGANALGGLGLPFWTVPLIAAAVNGVAKFFRDKWGVDVKVV